ncbi:LamG-like jellyroll fold domain-containing protein [Paenibacillus sp. Root444D2]|uniref:LamG-like jellyroll fold domain-containing protein n=1 Tax=Paenibacillus sp. Root444D2 TaxID=1736538 RepID=UPI00070EDC82|nr:LamG-like jellyroll fold domain-containing protein [Paenibacillus sp. Root444D2]KQX48844.1 hypothetical protein ASD40_11830 [Paenibacillus sp. Root444D2]
MKIYRKVRKRFVAALTLLMLVPVTLIIPTQIALAASEFTVNTGTVVVSDYIGNGAEFNQNLYASISAVDGITTGNVELLENEVKAMKPQIVRIFFDTKAFDTTNYPDYMSSFEKTVQLAQNSGSEINITYWHGPYTNVSQQMQDFANELYNLRVTKGYTNVKYITIQNEVNSTSITQTDYETFYRTLSTDLTTLGIRSSIKLIGGDLLYNNQQSWFDYMANNMSDVLDGYSVHIYWDYDNTAYAIQRLTDIRTIVDGEPMAGRKPVYIMEYGIRGDKISCTQDPGCLNGTSIPIEDTIINAYEHAWFTMNAMNKKFVATTKWDAYKAKYDNGTQYYGEIGSGTDGYPMKPIYDVTRLFSHTSNSHWQLVSVTGSVTGKLVTALKDPSSSNMAVYALNDTGASTTISIGGLGANKIFRMYVWNDNGDGGITDESSVQADSSGNITVRLNTQSFAAFTTLNPVDLERIANYKFDETSGTTGADSTEFVHNATIVNGTWTSGKIGGSLNFNGTSSYATTPHVLDPASPSNVRGFTAAAWVKLDNSSGGVQLILQQDGTNGKIWLCRRSDGTLETFLGGTATISMGTIPLGTWTHVGLTYDGTTARLYLNGVLDTSHNVTANSEAVGGMIIGADKLLGELWNGEIDDVSIYNRKLTAQEMKDIWNSGWWKFDETSGTTAADSNGYNQAATLVNGANWTTGKMNGALHLDGVNDYATLPNILNPVGNYFTATAWVKLDASSGTVQEILQQDGTNGKIWLYRRPEATLGTYLGGTPLLSTNTIPIGSWVFVAVSYDTSTVRLYLNGSLEASAAKTLQSETSGMLVGVSKTSDSYWNGGIDNLRIYNRQLSDNDILDAYRLGR